MLNRFGEQHITETGHTGSRKGRIKRLNARLKALRSGDDRESRSKKER